MSIKDKIYKWWKRKPITLRQPLVFILGLVLIIASPLVGTIPGPGGIIVFLAGIAVLASEFDWAEALQEFFLKTVPKKVQNRWRPTPRWQITFDVTAVMFLISALFSAYKQWWAVLFSLGISGFCIFLFNRDRLKRLKKQLRK